MLRTWIEITVEAVHKTAARLGPNVSYKHALFHVSTCRLKKPSTVQTFTATDKNKNLHGVSLAVQVTSCVFHSHDSPSRSSVSVVTISRLLYFFTKWEFPSRSVCSQQVSGSYTAAHFQLELSWQVCWWCTCYKTTWIIPGDISAGLRPIKHPGVSCNADCTDRTTWRGIVYSAAMY